MFKSNFSIMLNDDKVKKEESKLDESDIALATLPDGTQITKISCIICRVHRKKCSRNYPSCATCLKRGVGCEYPKRKVRGNMNKMDIQELKPILYKQTLLGKSVNGKMDNSNNCMTQVFKFHDINRSSGKSLNSSKNINSDRFIEEDGKVAKKEKRSLSISLSKAVEIFSYILNKSGFDYNNPILFRSADGSMEYCGASPVGTLLLNHLNLSTNFKSIENNIINLLTNFNVKVYNDLSEQLNDELNMNSKFNMNECIKAYFYHYSFFFPILDEQYLKDRKSDLLNKLVAAIGSKYILNNKTPKEIIDYLDRQAIMQFKMEFLSSKVEVIFGLMLIGQYQIGSTEFSSAWLYQSYNIIYTLLLGLNKSLPQSFNLTNRQKRLRCHHWWACCIQDKLNTSFLNRPMLLHANEIKMFYPKFEKLPKLDNCPSEKQFIMGRDQLAGIYFKYCVKLHELIGYATSCLISRFDKEKDIFKAHLLCQLLLKKLNSCFDNFIFKMHQVMHEQPEWLITIGNMLKMTNLCYRNATIIRLCAYFQRFVNSPISIIYDRLAAQYSAEIIVSANLLGNNFSRFGLVYRLYTVSSATLALARIANRTSPIIFVKPGDIQIGEPKDLPPLPSPEHCKQLSNLGLNILFQATPYLSIAHQFYKITLNLMVLECPKN